MTPCPKPEKLTEAEKRKMEQAVRVRDRICQRCKVWLIRLSESSGEWIGGHVHHKETRGAHGDSAWTLDNMELLCWKCHGKEDAPQFGRGKHG